MSDPNEIVAFFECPECGESSEHLLGTTFVRENLILVSEQVAPIVTRLAPLPFTHAERCMLRALVFVIEQTLDMPETIHVQETEQKKEVTDGNTTGAVHHDS